VAESNLKDDADIENLPVVATVDFADAYLDKKGAVVSAEGKGGDNMAYEDPGCILEMHSGSLEY